MYVAEKPFEFSKYYIQATIYCFYDMRYTIFQPYEMHISKASFLHNYL
jgi:hypothetical protein